MTLLPELNVTCHSPRVKHFSNQEVMRLRSKTETGSPRPGKVPLPKPSRTRHARLAGVARKGDREEEEEKERKSRNDALSSPPCERYFQFDSMRASLVRASSSHTTPMREEETASWVLDTCSYTR
ncbi:hypothetical protein E2C01_004330 [Portunus trituberculatus]|uniref:Uncharacterized protein n=1 Tax=Portunus trituberculatus TaxID=210409 RepID=A0A5B7CQA2_PORTR|nr:hypothetical protein [Portunus trituberculatus]